MKILWDETGKRFYETGVRNGVLYPKNEFGLYPLGVAWNGLTAVNENPTGAEANPLYADDIKYLNLLSAEEFEATIEAFTYPDEFEACDGSVELAPGVKAGQQKRQGFGMAYRTTLGNDIEDTEYGYKIHIFYDALAAPSSKDYETINDSPEAITFSWEITTTPVATAGVKPTASLTIDSTKVDSAALATLEDILYGTPGTDPRLPLPDEIAALFTAGEPAAVALSTIDPADNATDVAVDTTIVMTFNNKILREAVIVVDEAGDVVPGAKTWDVTGKILTFTPTSDLANNTVYITTLGGVVDIYAQSLTPVAKNFVTIA